MLSPENDIIDGKIYLITSLITGMKYVGKTIQTIEERFRQHLKDAKRKSKSKKTHFYNSLNTYGRIGFSIEVIHRTDRMDKLNWLEMFYIRDLDTFHNGFNSTTGGEGGKHSEETKKKIGISNTGKKKSEEEKKRNGILKLGNKNCLGKKKSEEEKKRMSQARLGKKSSEDTKKKQSDIRRNSATNFKGLYKGVCYDNARKKWKSAIKLFGKCINLGRFDNEQDAARAYNDAVDKYWNGEGYKNVI